MVQATVTSKGQITMPAEVRKTLGLRSGSRVTFVATGPGVYEIRRQSGSIRELKGAVRWSGPPVSLEQMEDAIAAGASAGGGRRDDRDGAA